MAGWTNSLALQKRAQSKHFRWNRTHKSAKIYKILSIRKRSLEIQRVFNEERGLDGLLSVLSNDCPVKSSPFESRLYPATHVSPNKILFSLVNPWFTQLSIFRITKRNLDAWYPHIPWPLLSLSKQSKIWPKVLRIRSVCCLYRGVCIISINFGNIVGDTWAHLNVISARRKIDSVEWSKLTWKSNHWKWKNGDKKKQKSESNKNVCTNTIKLGKR